MSNSQCKFPIFLFFLKKEGKAIEGRISMGMCTNFALDECLNAEEFSDWEALALETKILF